MFLGLDYGTSEVKALLMDRLGNIVAVAGSSLDISRPHPMWSEQNPDDWWRATVAVTRDLQQQKPSEYAKIQAIGLSGQMHGAVLVNQSGQVLRPAILWNDVRSHVECQELSAAFPQLQQLAGNLAMPGFTAPKLLWVAKHEPSTFAQVHKVLLPKDYIRFLLTGEYVSDMSDAAGTLWLDVAKRDWSDELLGATGLTRTHMPRLVEGSSVSATLLSSIATQLGLSQHAIVAGGGGDNASSAIGIGAVSDGDGFISLGTSGVIFVANDVYRPHPEAAVHTFCHALPNHWHQMSVMLSAASCLHWLSQMVGVKEAELLTEVEQLKEVSNAPVFLPYLSGERTPHNDPYAQGVFFGMTHATTRAHMAYAVIEGVSFGLLDGLNALRDSGTNVSVLSLVGGGSRSRYWAQLLADILQVEVHTHIGSEAGGALGAARLGALSFGLPQMEVCTKPPIAATFTPQESECLHVRYNRFKQLYQILKPVFHN